MNLGYGSSASREKLRFAKCRIKQLFVDIFNKYNANNNYESINNKFEQELYELKCATNEYIKIYYSLNPKPEAFYIDKIYFSKNNDKNLFGFFIYKEDMFLPRLINDRSDNDDRNDKTITHHSMSIDIDSKLLDVFLFNTIDTYDSSEKDKVSLADIETVCILYIEYLIFYMNYTDTILMTEIEHIAEQKGYINCIKNLYDMSLKKKNLLVQIIISDYIYRRFDMCNKYEIFRSFENNMIDYNYTNNAPISLTWLLSIINSFNIYKTIKRQSLEITQVIDAISTETGSVLLKEKCLKFNNFYSRQFFDISETYNLYEKKPVTEASLFTKIRKNGLKSIENDIYEFDMRIKNIDDEDSAIFLMRQLNSRISIIADYIDEESLSEAELKRWNDVYDKYLKLRDKLTNKAVYSRKMYGLFVDYNALMANTNQNMMTMNTLY